MFLTSSVSSAPRAAQGEPVAKKSKSQDVSRQIDNLDYRLRQLEGDRVTYCFSAERCPGVVATVESGGGPLQEQSAAERPASPRPQKKKRRSWQPCSTGQRRKTTLRSTNCAKEEVDRLHKVLAALRKLSLPEQLTALKNNPALQHEPVTDGKRGGNLLLLLSQTRSQQTCRIIQSTATFSSQRSHDTHVLRAGSNRRSTGARSATQRSTVQMKLDRHAPRDASGRHTRSMYDNFSPRASSDTGRCVGVRAAVPPRHVREADGEARALDQLPSWGVPQSVRVLKRHMGHESARQQRRRVSDYSQPSSPFEPRLGHTSNL